ncbi:MAG: anti-anti-sigma factor, partial [Kiritimatiellae bacterium]|nr:anti-anti-sigma factor [Kiritimatiellia bacterium]
GELRDILHSRVTTERIYSKRFFDKEYSIGMGGLGAGLEDYINLLGEMITIGGTMVWLPTDGHDTADFLIPKTDQGDVMIRTGFNVSIKGGVNEYVYFKSATAGGTPVGALYRELFSFAKKRRPDFRGALGLVIRAQLGAVYGSGIKKSAVTQNAPANGKMILHESNRGEWFDGDTAPRHTRVTGLIVGIGADLTADLSDYDEEDFNRVFYMHPANISGKEEMLHNHAVIFNEQPLPQHPTRLEEEIHRVIEQGTFLDMRHLLDSSTITEALIGIHYLQAFRSDPEGVPLDQGKAEPMPEIKKSQMRYYQG